MPVYFIQAGENGPVKIGYAKDVFARAYGLQCGHYDTLNIIRVIDLECWAELWLHDHFKSSRIRGEWFKYAPEMESVVPCESQRERFSPQKSTTAPRVDRVSKLQDFLNLQGLTRGEFADQVGTTAEAVRLWLTDQRMPKRKSMEKIVALTNGAVTANDFFDEYEAAP